jgi:PAS domain S-box-containing protein
MLFHQDDIASVHASMDRLTAGLEPRNVHSSRNHTRDGRTVCCRWYNSAFIDENGNLISLLSTVEDVTERTEADDDQRFRIQVGLDLARVTTRQESVRIATRLLAERLAGNRCFLAEFNPQKNTVTIADDYSGVLPSLEGEWSLDNYSVIVEESKAGRIVRVDDVSMNAALAPMQERFQRAAIGSFVTVPLGRRNQWAASLIVARERPTVWKDREVNLIHAVAERLWPALETARLFDELQVSEQHFRKLAETIPDMVWTAGPGGGVDYYNGRWSEFVGDSLPSPLGKGWASLVHPEDLPSVQQAWSRAVQTGETYEAEARFLHRSGRWRWIVGRAAPLQDASGRIVRWFGTNTDIDDHKRSTEALQDANRLLHRSNEELRQYAWAASHDLQEPLRMVVAFSQMAMRRHAPQLGDDGARLLQITVDGALRMERLLNDLKEYWLISDSRDEQFETVNLNLVLGTVLQNLQASIAAAGALVTFGELPEVLADRIPITLLLQNLVSNALKYRHPDRAPVISIHSHRSGNEHLISVRDNGIGIEPEYHDRIFGLFKRLHTRDQYPGTGIGLALCKKIVERHQGRLFVESETGQGSVFTIALPDLRDLEQGR